MEASARVMHHFYVAMIHVYSTRVRTCICCKSVALTAPEAIPSERARAHAWRMLGSEAVVPHRPTEYQEGKLKGL